MTTPLGPEQAELIASVVLEVPGVAGLHTGIFGEAVTQLPGHRVDGVVIGHESCSVHITAYIPGDPDAVARAVREALARILRMPVIVTVEDLVTETPNGAHPEG